VLEKKKEKEGRDPLILPNNYGTIYYKSGIRQFSPQIFSPTQKNGAKDCQLYAGFTTVTVIISW